MKRFSILYSRPFAWGFSGSKGTTLCNVTVTAQTAELAGESFLRASRGKGYSIRAIDEIGS